MLSQFVKQCSHTTVLTRTYISVDKFWYEIALYAPQQRQYFTQSSIVLDHLWDRHLQSKATNRARAKTGDSTDYSASVGELKTRGMTHLQKRKQSAWHHTDERLGVASSGGRSERVDPHGHGSAGGGGVARPCAVDVPCQQCGVHPHTAARALQELAAAVGVERTERGPRRRHRQMGNRLRRMHRQEGTDEGTKVAVPVCILIESAGRAHASTRVLLQYAG
eukprot:m.406483 g.406483  ORF g.406483 m.406483 type:complete len:221 (-) comp21216_c0_seq2:705-1367(-)